MTPILWALTTISASAVVAEVGLGKDTESGATHAEDGTGKGTPKIKEATNAWLGDRLEGSRRQGGQEGESVAVRCGVALGLK